VPHAIENAEWLPLGQKSVQPERDPAPQPATATAPAISEPVVYVPSRVGATAILKKSTKKYTELSSASGAELVSFGLGEPLISSKVDAATLGKQIHRALECDDATQLDSVLQRDGFQLSAFYDWLKTSEGRICFPKMSSQICLSHAPGAGSPVDPALRRRAEFAFDLKIQSGSVMTGRVDLMIEWPKEKKLWIVDHKIHFRRRTKEHLFQEHKEQLMLYADAIKKLVPNYQLQTYVVDVTASTGSVWHCFSSESC
jgi:ATP-dependent exoDNAse (exonuclease V) beta subunit